MQPEGEEWTKIDAGVAAPPPQRHLANATLFMLARNSDVDSAVHSVREMEDRFNHNYGYPWVFLNEEPFSEGMSPRVINSDPNLQFSTSLL